MIFLPTVEEAHAIGNDEGVFPASVQHGSQPVVRGTPTGCQVLRSRWHVRVRGIQSMTPSWYGMLNNKINVWRRLCHQSPITQGKKSSQAVNRMDCLLLGKTVGNAGYGRLLMDSSRQVYFQYGSTLSVMNPPAMLASSLCTPVGYICLQDFHLNWLVKASSSFLSWSRMVLTFSVMSSKLCWRTLSRSLLTLCRRSSLFCKISSKYLSRSSAW